MWRIWKVQLGRKTVRYMTNSHVFQHDNTGTNIPEDVPNPIEIRHVMNIKLSRFDFNCLKTPSDNFKKKKGDKIAVRFVKCF